MLNFQDILPDFLTGGSIDISNYNDGLRGGRIRCRAKISQNEKKQLVITEIPFGTTTSGLMDSIVAANEKEKIKVKKIDAIFHKNNLGSKKLLERRSFVDANLPDKSNSDLINYHLINSIDNIK